MRDSKLNDYDATPARHDAGGVDPHGHAAMLLVESLIHGLVTRSILSVADAVMVVASAMEVQDDYVMANEDTTPVMRKAGDLLAGVRASLSIDLAPDPA